MDTQFTSISLIILAVLVASWYTLPGTWARILLALARRAAGLRSHCIDVGGLRWHYLSGGRGPVLVMLHGFGGDSDHWLRVAPRLRRRFTIVAPDLVGFGRSKADASTAFDITSQAGRLREFLDACNVDHCILAGNSMGGWVATVFTATNPERVRALWLLAPLGVREARKSPLLRAIEERKESPMQVQSRVQFETRVLHQMFARVPWIPRPLKIHYARDAIRRSPAAERIFREVRGEPGALEDTAAMVQVPVLLQWGDRDRAVDVTGAAALRRAFADIELQIQPGVGHLPMLETPAASLACFLDFNRRRIRGAAVPSRPNAASGGL